MGDEGQRGLSVFPLLEHPLAVNLQSCACRSGVGMWAEPTHLEHVSAAVVGVLHHHGLGPGQRVGDTVLLLVTDGLQRKTHSAVNTPRPASVRCVRRGGGVCKGGGGGGVSHLGSLWRARGVHRAGPHAIGLVPAAQSEAAPPSALVPTGQRAVTPAMEKARGRSQEVRGGTW